MELGEKRILGLRILIVHRELLRLREATIEEIEVGEDELEVDGLDITNRIYGTIDMHDVVIIEAANDVHDGVGLTDVRQELVTETLTLGSALDETCDIDELDHRRHDLLRIIQGAQLLKTLIRYSDDTDVRLDRTERVVGRLRARLRNCVKQCRLADIRQSDDT